MIAIRDDDTRPVPRPRWTRTTSRKPQLVTRTDERGQAWAWLGVPLNGERMLGERGWIAEYRLAIQEGRLIVAEVRVCPARWADWGEGAGEGAGMGILAADVPAGGLSTRLLRRLTIGAHVDYLGELLERLGGTVRWPDGRVEKFPSVLDSYAVLDHLASATPTTRVTREVDAKRPGRRPLSDEVLVEATAAYLDARKRGSPRPVPDAARALRMSEARMRDLVYRARRRGLLTSTRQGRGGGTLTAEARALLSKVRRGAHRRPR